MILTLPCMPPSTMVTTTAVGKAKRKRQKHAPLGIDRQSATISLVTCKWRTGLDRHTVGKGSSSSALLAPAAIAAEMRVWLLKCMHGC